MLKCLDKLELSLFAEGRQEEPNLLDFYCCLSDPRTSFEVFHSYESWKLHDVQLIKLHSRKIGYAFVDAGGRDTGKTSTDIEMIRERALVAPFEKTVYIVKSDIHLVTMQDELEKMFDIHPYLRLMKGAWNKRDKGYRFETMHNLYLRILGSDIEGESKAQAAHVQMIIIDEAQLASSELIGNIMHAMLPGCVIWISGVVNDDRTSALFAGVKNKEFIYFRYASYEGLNWTPIKEKLYLEEYGSKSSKGWRNSIEGKWNEPSFGLVPEEDYYSCVEDSPKFRMITDRILGKTCVDYKELIRFNYLPDVLEPEYYIGIDVGDEKSYGEVLVMANIRDIYEGKKFGQKSSFKKLLLHRISMLGVRGNIHVEILDYIFQGYSPKKIAMDAHIVGRASYESLLQEPYLNRNYKETVFPFIPNENVRTGWIEDKETGRKKEDKQQQKYFTSVRVASEFLQKKYVIPQDGSDMLKKAVLGEHAIRRPSSKYPTYENYYPSLEHLFDAFRAVELAWWLDNEYVGRNESSDEEDLVEQEFYVFSSNDIY